MAIDVLKEKLTLRLEFDDGVVNGKQKVHPKTFAQIKTTADDLNLHAAAKTIASLQNRPLLKVQRIETTSLIEE
ncbi:hypothetical protein CIW83_11135 [Tissierella sp. P1]|jgi:hypothetical protein|uniref:DUF1659 domain-containing protein n=1 Tax=Tissierella carlieri TaxID=689904 RepID=A0ABT1S9C8_9FIRM|nr:MULTISPECIES: DUF1659 domain-containing protein [Tissierella]MCQ4923071.1 DUF1659 domain-containing protein [Tissierella carlieri]OZV12167.1 hypothetical protein CIW83_11135 [Tissierella sp. P1]